MCLKPSLSVPEAVYLKPRQACVSEAVCPISVTPARYQDSEMLFYTTVQQIYPILLSKGGLHNLLIERMYDLRLLC